MCLAKCEYHPLQRARVAFHWAYAIWAFGMVVAGMAIAYSDAVALVAERDEKLGFTYKLIIAQVYFLVAGLLFALFKLTIDPYLSEWGVYAYCGCAAVSNEIAKMSR